MGHRFDPHRTPAWGATVAADPAKAAELFRSAPPRGGRLLRYKQRKRKTKMASSREAGAAAPILPGAEQYFADKKLIYNDKERPRTGQGSAGHFRFALRA